VQNEMLPLLFQEATNPAAIARAVLRASVPAERPFLLANPRHLGVRCEAHLAGVAPEWFADNGFLDDADREWLGRLAVSALP
jgi:hypothetical protein